MGNDRTHALNRQLSVGEQVRKIAGKVLSASSEHALVGMVAWFVAYSSRAKERIVRIETPVCVIPISSPPHLFGPKMSALQLRREDKKRTKSHAKRDCLARPKYNRQPTKSWYARRSDRHPFGLITNFVDAAMPQGMSEGNRLYAELKN